MERVLLISNNVVSKVDNNGKTIRSLLRGFPRENIAQFYIGNNEYADEEVCDSFYRVTDSQVLKSILTLSFKTVNSHKKLTPTANKVTQPGKDNSLIRFIRHNAKSIALLREAFWGLYTWDSKDLNEWIKEFKPTVIFAVLGDNYFMHKITLKLSARYNLPIAVFFTDDYVINDYSTNLFQKLHLKLVRNIYEKTLERAKRAFVIGDYMKEAYTSKYKRSFGVLINGIDFNKIPNRVLKINPDTEIVVSFIGGVHLKRWESICKLGKLLNLIPDYKTTVKVFTIVKPDDEILQSFSNNGIEYCGSLSPSQVEKQIASSHILLHAESFDEAHRLFTRFSISTKIPEYLSSMRGVIAFGPHEIASIKIFSDNNLGCVLTDLDDDASMVSKISGYLSNYNCIDFERYYSFAKEHFNQDNMLLSKVLPPLKYLKFRRIQPNFFGERRAA